MNKNTTKLEEPQAKEYLEENGVLDILSGVSPAPDQFPPNLVDLARLHRLVVSRKCFTVLEFGVGWSTIVLAAALKDNERRWDQSQNRPRIRNETPFSVYSVDASRKWVDNARRMIPKELFEYTKIHYSKVEAGTFNSRLCHFYEDIPDVIPDFIYLDAPHHDNVDGNVNGLSWKNQDRTIIAGDLLTMESTLLPGTCVLVDGRTNNARFLERNLQRGWSIVHDVEGDVTIMELQEAPLGRLNENTLRYCLGDEYFERLNTHTR